MVSSRIKNVDLAAQMDDGQLAWQRYITPITEHYVRQISERDYRGKRLAYWGHITKTNTVAMRLALKQAGAEIVIGACNVDSTDDVAAAYAVSQGIHVYGWQGMSQSEYQENLASVRSFEADYLCDMGGELTLYVRDLDQCHVAAPFNLQLLIWRIILQKCKYSPFVSGDAA